MTETIPPAISGSFTFDDFANSLASRRSGPLQVEWWIEREDLDTVHVKMSHEGESEHGVATVRKDGVIADWPWVLLIGWEAREGSLRWRLEDALVEHECAVCHELVLTSEHHGLCSAECEDFALEHQEELARCYE